MASRMAPGFPGQLAERAGEGWNALIARVNPCDPAGFADPPPTQADASTGGFEILGDVRDPHLQSFALRMDSNPRRLRLAAGPAGCHPLYWCRAPGEGWLASRIELLLQANGVTRREQEAYFAAHYGHADPDESITAYRDIHAIPAGATLEYRGGACQVSRSAREPDDSLWHQSARALTCRMGELRDIAVRRSCVPDAALGLLLSGGFDSASILASLLGNPGAGKEPLCATAGYRHPRVADERALAADLRRRLGVRGLEIDARLNLPTLPGFVDTDAPCGNPFRKLNDALYAGLAVAGVQCVVTGQFADELDASGLEWYHEWRSPLTPASLPVTDLLRSLPDLIGLAVRRLRRHRASAIAVRDPLLPEWQRHLAECRDAALARYRDWPRPHQAAAVLGAGCRDSEWLEARHFERHGLLPRHPFRDWDLVRFMLSLPAAQTAVMRRTKLIQRRAAPRRLPAQVISRGKCGTLAPLLQEAVRSALPRIKSVLLEVPVWRRYLSADALDSLQLVDDFDLDRVCRMLGHALWAAPDAIRSADAAVGRHQ